MFNLLAAEKWLFITQIPCFDYVFFSSLHFFQILISYSFKNG